jgi:hypothetical protein
MRALIAGLIAAALAGCGAAAPSPPPRGFVNASGGHFSFARPAGWRPIEMRDRGSVGFQSVPGAHGIPTQVGLGFAEDYPNSLEAAVDFAKGESRIVYPDYEVVAERWLKVPGARAYRIDSTYSSFASSPTVVRNVDLYVQTEDGVQLNLFVRGPAEDWDEARVRTIVDSLEVK